MIASWLASTIASYGFEKILDKTLFESEEEFEDLLQEVIYETIQDFEKEHSISEEDSRDYFYHYKVPMEILLKYRLFEDNEEIINKDILLEEIKKNPNIIIPTEEEIENFLTIFEENIRKDEKLKKQFCLENASEKIFELSKNIKDIFDSIEKKLNKIDNKADNIESIVIEILDIIKKRDEISSPTKQLKILSITASPEDNEIFYEKEQETILEAFADISHDKLFLDLPDPIYSTKPEIKKYLKDGKHDILQITAHGGIDDDDDGYLIFEKYEDGRWIEDKITADELSEFLQKQEELHDIDLKLIILSSCYSGDEEASFVSVARTLHEDGFPNVIVMKKSISHEASNTYNTAMFNALIGGKAVENAHKIGKDAIQRQEQRKRNNNTDQNFESEADIPVLFSNQSNITKEDFSPHIIEAESKVKLRQFKSNTVHRGFVGRRQQIREIFKRKANNDPAIVLKGPAGVGKSTLTARILVELKREDYFHIEFQDEVEPAAIIDKIVIKISDLLSQSYENIKRDLDNLETTSEKWRYFYNKYLSDKKIVIVFDNFEDNQDLNNRNKIDRDLKLFLKQIEKTFNVNKSLMIISTRYRLPDFGDYIIDVPEYTTMELQKKIYFEECLQKLDREAMNLFRDTFGKNPRALDLMKSLLKKKLNRYRKMEKINLDTLEEQFPDLKEQLSSGQGADRDFSPFILDELLKLLSDTQENILKVMSIYRKPVREEGIQHFQSNYDKEDLYNLEDLSLLEISEIENELHFYTHRLTAEYYKDRLTKEEIIKLNKKAADYWEKVFENNKTIENYLEIKEYLLQAEEYDEAADIAFSAQSYLTQWGDMKYALDLNLDTLDTDISLKNQAKAKTNIGLIYSQTGEPEKALTYHKQALKINRDINNRSGEASALGNIGNIHGKTGESEKALEYHKKALEMYKNVNNKCGESSALCNIGLSYYNTGNQEKALKFYKQALEIHKYIKDKSGKAIILGNIGNVYSTTGEPKEALKYYNQALKIFRNISHKNGVANQLGNIGNVYSDIGEIEEALKYYKQTLEIHRDINNKNGEAASLGNIGLLYYDNGELEEAHKYYKKALEINKGIRNKKEEATNIGNIGAIHQKNGKQKKALKYYKQALEIQRKIKDRTGEAKNLINIGSIYQNTGQPEKALKYHKQALKIYRDINDRNGEADQHGNIGVIYYNTGKSEKAVQHLFLAMNILFDLKSPKIETAIAHLIELKKEIGEEKFKEVTQKLDLSNEEYGKVVQILEKYISQDNIEKLKQKLSQNSQMAILAASASDADTEKLLSQLQQFHEKIPVEQEEIKTFSKFLLSYAKNENVEEIKSSVNEEFLKLFNNELENHKFVSDMTRKITEDTKKAIKTFHEGDDFTSDLRQQKGNLPDDSAPEIMKYYDFLIDYSQGKEAEKMKDSIGESLWDIFQKVLQEMQDKSK